MIGAGFGWTRLFYFDFKRLALRSTRFFKERFERFLRRVALVFSAILAAFAMGWMWLFWGGEFDHEAEPKFTICERRLSDEVFVVKYREKLSKSHHQWLLEA